jgi:hypothetical protein
MQVIFPALWRGYCKMLSPFFLKIFYDSYQAHQNFDYSVTGCWNQFLLSDINKKE